MTNIKIRFTPYLFTEYLAPEDGVMPQAVGAHALLYYYFLAVKVVHANKFRVYLEDDPYPQEEKIILRRLYLATCIQYGVNPDYIQQFWDVVEMQLAALNRIHELQTRIPGAQAYPLLPAWAKAPT